MRLHHAAICATDIDASIVFWRDGLGLVELMDHSFDGDWPTLFGAASTRLRSVFLGDPDRDDAGIVELVDFGSPLTDPVALDGPRSGFFLLSFNVDLTATLARLAELGIGGEPVEIAVHGVRMAVVEAPDGVRVELIDLPEVDQASMEA
jgi:glyoxylase I family protein